jgi:hypothetical protein
MNKITHLLGVGDGDGEVKGFLFSQKNRSGYGDREAGDSMTLVKSLHCGDPDEHNADLQVASV